MMLLTNTTLFSYVLQDSIVIYSLAEFSNKHYTPVKRSPMAKEIGHLNLTVEPEAFRNAIESGRWTVDAWAPLEGRVVNGGARFRF
jgi:hypothetical protein